MSLKTASALLAAFWLTPAALCAPDVPRAPSALLPASLIVTYYGNPLSKRMGILGEIPVGQMLARLEAEARAWQKSDPGSTVRPGLELVAAVASATPGEGGRYCTRMPPELIERVIGWARRRGWPTILDVQVGRSSVRAEVSRLLPYLRRPDVHLALDPEFHMRRGLRPGQRIGSSDAEDVNVAIIMLGELVTKHRLPPKLLLVHRFTDDMLRRHDKIRLDPRVQVVMVMDGFGTPALKRKIYGREVTREPVEYGGIKLFYKNDKPMLSQAEVLKLLPVPRVIIYQ